MKIEKLTENKIRVVVHIKELGLKTANVHTIMSNAIKSEDFFYDILNQAEKEVSFYTDGCKLLIETFSSLEDVIVFTITKYNYSSIANTTSPSKRVIARKKAYAPNGKEIICNFEDFEAFCEFCNSIKGFNNMEISKIVRSSVLYLWKGNYYLVINCFKLNSSSFDSFYSTLYEFGNLFSCSENFSSKLAEHGTVIIKNKAINVGMKYFG